MTQPEETATTDNPLSHLADVAAHLFITLPESPQGKPFISRDEAGSPANLLRAIRKRLNLTQREFGVLLSAGGASPISPSVICQLEASLQSVPPTILTRAISATAAIQRFGEFVASKRTGCADAAAVLKSLGPGCIDQLEPYVNENADLPATDAALVGEFLAIVTKRKPSTGGSRPGARGPYRKLNKLNNFSAAVVEDAAPAAAAPALATPVASAADATAGTPHAATVETTPDSLSLTSSPRSSMSSTPCSTPSSSRGSSRPRSPLGSDAASVVSVGEASDSTSYNILMALRRLQEENENLVQENKRLRAMVHEPETEGEQSEVPRGDIGMHC